MSVIRPGMGPRVLAPGSFGDDPISKLQRDLELITAKLTEIRGGSAGTPTAQPQKTAIAVVSSSFVSGIRKATELSAGDPNERISLIDRFLERITEFDREVLKKTTPTGDTAIIADRRPTVRADLSNLPTHLHITDRLLDLYAQAQRVTVIRTSATVAEQGTKSPVAKVPAAAPSANDQALAQSQQHIQRLEGKIATLMKQLSDSEEKTLAAQSATKSGKIEVAEMQKTLSQSMLTVEALRKEAAAATAAAAAAAAAAATVISPTKSAANAAEERVRQLEERLEVEIGINQRMYSAVMGVAESFGKDGTMGDVGASALSGDSRHALDALTGASRAVAEQLKAAGAACSGMKREHDDVESRLAVLQRDHGSLLTAHDDSKVELSTLRAQLDKFRSKEQRDQSLLVAKVQADGDQLDKLKTELSNALAKIVELEKLTPAFNEALGNLFKKDQELDGLAFDLAQLTEELASYKTLAETLKAKMRDMGGKDAAFFDSFEEVMRDEMAAMKWAFEAKLRVAKEKADAMSVKHQQEMQKLRESNSQSSKLHVLHQSGSTASFPR